MIASTQTNHPLSGNSRPQRSPSAVELATTKLRAAGLRITQPRLAILAALNKREQPTSIEQIHEDVGAGPEQIRCALDLADALMILGVLMMIGGVGWIVATVLRNLSTHLSRTAGIDKLGHWTDGAVTFTRNPLAIRY